MTYTLHGDPATEQPEPAEHGARRERPRSGRSGPWLAVLLIAALAITLAGVFPFRQIIAQDRQVESTREKLAALAAENEALEDDIEVLQTEAEIERIAREELGLVRPGEVGYTVQPGNTPAVTTAPIDTITRDERSFVDKIWDFLTGRDLAPDG